MSLSGVVVLIGSGDIFCQSVLFLFSSLGLEHDQSCSMQAFIMCCVVVGRVIGFARVQLLVARNRTSHGNVWHSNDDDEKQG